MYRPQSTVGAGVHSNHISSSPSSPASADFFAGSSDSDSDDSEQEAPAKDELQAYLELPQVKCATEQEALNWWRDRTLTSSPTWQ